MSRRLRAAAVALVGIVVLPSCSLVGGGDSYEVVAYFPRAVSLYESGSVQVLGLPAGEVSDIEVVGDQVKVTMDVHADIPLPSDVKAAIVPQSLIGERRVQLFPPFQEGDEVVSDGHVIPEEDTLIPVEPDEALAALKEFLDSLDPNGVGRLIDNAATALDGQGENLGGALDELSELVGNIEENDDSIIAIAERFDDFTSTLLRREDQLGQAIDDFAVVAGVLADERKDIERLVQGLADLSGDGLDLVSEHAVRLRTDIDIVTRLARSIHANLGSVQDLLSSGPPVYDGFIDAYNPELRAINLRNNFAPLVSEALKPIFDSVGVPLPCIPVTVACPESAPLAGLDAGEAVDVDLDRPTTPVDDILAALGSPTEGSSIAEPARPSSSGPSAWQRFVGTFLGVGS